MKAVDNTVDAILNATRPFTKAELGRILSDLYNAGYDDGRNRGYEMAMVDISRWESDD